MDLCLVPSNYEQMIPRFFLTKFPFPVGRYWWWFSHRRTRIWGPLLRSKMTPYQQVVQETQCFVATESIPLCTYYLPGLFSFSVTHWFFCAFDSSVGSVLCSHDWLRLKLICFQPVHVIKSVQSRSLLNTISSWTVSDSVSGSICLCFWEQFRRRVMTQLWSPFS